MSDVGRNPARIIPAWADFVRRHADAPAIRGIGEPIDARRSPAELAECQRHESLLNVAFDGGPRLWLQCPYDLEGLPTDVLDEARRSHPFVTDGRDSELSVDYQDRGTGAAGFDEPLPEPPATALEIAFRGGWLSTVRDFVAGQAGVAGLALGQAADLVLAVNELATNSLRYGGGKGTLRVWHTDHSLVCEVTDKGRLSDPLIGREQPGAGRLGGRGLWMVNQLCDLVQIRSLAAGTVVRVHSYHD
jgi:anti-sigma regulatory factor (Ser/Thr protein kinase)